MEKSRFEKDFIEKLNKNYHDLAENFKKDLGIFTEFNTLIFEINKCLILELHRAAITLSNYFLERLMKLALIKHDTGISSIPIDRWDDTFKGPMSKYQSIVLRNSIDACYKKKLINKAEYDFLNETIRNMIRNGFSHADHNKIIKDFPDEVQMYSVSITNPNVITPVKINQKLSPEIQAFQVNEYAKNVAKSYFTFIRGLSFKIEDRLRNIHPE